METFQQMASAEVVVRKPTLIYRFLILMYQVIDPPMPRVFTEGMNWAKNAPMRLVFVKLSKVHLVLSFSQLQEEWLMKLLFFRSALPPCFLTSGTQIMQL